MQIITGMTEFEIDGKSAIAIGKFDGLHIGHFKLLQKILDQKQDGLLAVVFTFDTSAASFFGKTKLPELTTRDEKRAYFEQAGIDVLIEYPLNKDTACISPELFITRILLDQMHMAYIAAGTDLSFGDKGAGNAGLLQRMSRQYEYQMDIIDKVRYEDREVSSTYVREEVEKGNMELVTRLLGRPYQISGAVITGNRIGRTLGMPTVNLYPDPDKMMPPFGVYYSKVTVEDQTVYNGITNIGYKPTVTQDKILGVETYLYEFEQDIYGKQIVVELLAHSRPEQKFAGLDALKEQLQKDVADGNAYFQEKADKM